MENEKRRIADRLPGFPGCRTGRAVLLSRLRPGGPAALINGDYSACTQSKNYCDQHGTPYRAHGSEGLTIVGTVSQERLDGPNMGDGDNNSVRRPFLIAGNGTPL
jgi:hypothetical protein